MRLSFETLQIIAEETNDLRVAGAALAALVGIHVHTVDGRIMDTVSKAHLLKKKSGKPVPPGLFPEAYDWEEV